MPRLREHGNERGNEQQRHDDIERPHMPRVLEEAAEPRAEGSPGRARRHAEHRERGREQHYVPRKAGECRVGGNRAERDDPALGVDPLERHPLKEGQRPALLLALLDLAGGADRPGEIEEIGGARVFQHHIERGIDLEDGAEPDAEQEHHQPEADGDAEHVRQRAREAEIQPRTHQHDVVRPRREQHHDGEEEKGGEEFEGHGDARSDRLLGPGRVVKLIPKFRT